jgi:homoserine O-acetyltransferase
MEKRPMFRWLALMAAAYLIAAAHPATAQDLIVEKKVFELPSFATQSGKTLGNVKVGWESYGILNADKSNAILICHYFSGTSHAAGKYTAADPAPGYWDAIIGPGKAIDTDRYFVLSSDTLVNLNAYDKNVTTTGPASTHPDTGKPYGLSFPIVTIRDFVEVQRQLVGSLGIRKLVMVAGPSMGALQTYEWAVAYPEMVGKIMPVIGSAEADAHLVAWLDIWASPIRLDPKWNGGDYYGKEPPTAGLAQALKIVTMHAQHWEWANAAYGRKWAREGHDPARGFDKRFAIESALQAAATARAKLADANHFLYLVKANQLFVAGGGALAEGLNKIKAPVLLITQPEDLVFHPDGVTRTVEGLEDGGAPVEHVTLEGSHGHLDGLVSIKQAEKKIAEFLAK